MAYDEWSDEFQELWDDIPGVSHFREYESEIAGELFERGWMGHSDDPGYDPIAAAEARDEFFEYTGLPEELFPWDEWREAMGY